MPSTRTILVVDDEDDLREVLRDFLELEGYAVVVAENGLVALQLLPQLPATSTILLDLMMPVMDGYTFLDRLRQSCPGPQAGLPVLVVSAHPPARPPGATAFLRKPVDLDVLLSTLHALE